MITRIPQRTQDDCAICSVAMVMGPPYSYERVLVESGKYRKRSSDRKFPAWWETYLYDEGFEGIYCHLDRLRALSLYGGKIVGLLCMDIPHENCGHVVAVDEIGVVDPADNAPDHVPLNDYLRNRTKDGVIVDCEWLAVRKSPTDRSARRSVQLQEKRAA